MSPVRSEPYYGFKNAFLGVTLLKDLITLIGVALLEVFRKFNRTVTLLEDLQMVVKSTLLRDLDHCYNG